MASNKKLSREQRTELENDPEWKKWFQAVARRRKEQEERVKKGDLRFSHFWVEGEEKRIVRPAGPPQQLKEILKTQVHDFKLDISYDLELLQATWAKVVGKQLANDSAVFSFKGGVLTIEVFSNSLFQEIRSFHAEAILKDLHDAWPLKLPLASIRYRQGRRKDGPSKEG